MNAHDVIDEIVYSLVKSTLGEEEKKEIFFLIRKLRVLVDPRIKQGAAFKNVSETRSNSMDSKVLCKAKSNKR